MLNQTGIKKTVFNSESEILVDIPNHTAVSIILSDEGVTANGEGKKMVYAGQPVYGELTNRDEPFKITGTGDPAGVIRHMVDLTTGNQNSQCVIFGTVDLSKVEENTATVLQGVANNFKMIQVIK